MTVSSGFFNSVNHDRLYDATQLSSIFDGIIKDGVYQGIGKALRVSAKTDSNNTVIIGSGRAWFDHTWTLNDSDYALVLDSPNEFLGRIDAIVLDVNREESTRKNEIKYLVGAFSSSPQKPELIKSTLHNQYPLAYITIKPGSDAPISDANIEICVGTDACPLVTGLLEVINSDVFMQQVKGEFYDWYNGIKDLIDENTALKLQNQIDEINNKIENSSTLGVPQEAYDYATNWEIYGVDEPHVHLFVAQRYSEKYFLPDGYIIDVGPFNDSTISATDEGHYVCAHIIDKNLSIVSSTLLINIQTPNDIYPVFGVCINADSYPASFKFFVNGSQYDTSNNKIISHKLHVIDVTVSSSHVVSKTVTTKSVPKNSSYGDGSHYSGFTNPVYFEDGSYLIHTSASNYSSSNRIYGCFFKISNENVIAYTEADVFSIRASGRYDPTLYLTSDEQYIILSIDSSYGNVYQSATFTEMGTGQYPMERDPRKIKKPIGLSGYYYYKNAKYLQDSNTINIDSGVYIPFILNVDYDHVSNSSPSRVALTPDGKFIISGYDYESNYTYTRWYASLCNFSRDSGFSMAYNFVDSLPDNYGNYNLNPSEKTWYHDETDDTYRYLDGTKYNINMEISENYKYACLINYSRGSGIYIIRRKES